MTLKCHGFGLVFNFFSRNRLGQELTAGWLVGWLVEGGTRGTLQSFKSLRERRSWGESKETATVQQKPSSAHRLFWHWRKEKEKRGGKDFRVKKILYQDRSFCALQGERKQISSIWRRKKVFHYFSTLQKINKRERRRYGCWSVGTTNSRCCNVYL